ncbi:MAG: hypothetical protein V1663_02000 [archaeon]
MAELMIIPPLILSVIIGLYELILIHKDENFRGSHWFSHGLHAVGWAILALFVVMNADYVYENFTFLQSIPFIGNVLVFRILIGLLTILKIHGASAVVRTTVGTSRGLKETWAHSLVVGILIVISPYIWPFIAPLFDNLLASKK